MRVSKSGFTLVELVLVLVIIGLLSAVAIPKYIEANNKKQISQENYASGSVRTAWVVAKADIKQKPSVTVLASYVQAEKVNVTNEGIMFQQNGKALLVPTFMDDNCTEPTHSPNDQVACVGSIH